MATRTTVPSSKPTVTDLTLRGMYDKLDPNAISLRLPEDKPTWVSVKEGCELAETVVWYYPLDQLPRSSRRSGRSGRSRKEGPVSGDDRPHGGSHHTIESGHESYVGYEADNDDRILLGRVDPGDVTSQRWDLCTGRGDAVVQMGNVHSWGEEGARIVPDQRWTNISAFDNAQMQGGNLFRSEKALPGSVVPISATDRASAKSHRVVIKLPKGAKTLDLLIMTGHAVRFMDWDAGLSVQEMWMNGRQATSNMMGIGSEKKDDGVSKHGEEGT